MANNQRPTTNNAVRVAYLDCFSGISGDMFLGALIDAGLSPTLLEETVDALNVGATLKVSRVDRSGITATKVDVIVGGKHDSYGSDIPVRQNPAEPLHNHARPHDHGDPHEHPHKHEHARKHQHGRGLLEIREIINKAAISDSAKKTAISIFEKLGAAESKIHNVPLAKIHFHEVGAVDALVDITCAAVGAEALGVDEIVCSPLNVGGGTVNCAHGTFPVPAPATVELLKGAPVYSSGIQAELVTPTGAAIVRTIATRFAAFPPMKIEKAGYGAGTRDLPNHANVLRITIGDRVMAERGEGARPTHILRETISVLEANLDDLNPQVFGYVMDRLLEAGALDVFGTPVQMKKNRPGMLLTALAKPEDTDKLVQIIFAETTTLGIRRREETRQALARKWETVTTRFGDVRMKIASMNGSISSYAPEYEDCRRIAREQRVPLKMVMQEAVREYLQSEKR
ncbi:MAG TPA: nickel pincer cofactor biosynthesis protein LarC [Terriglobales bacterium]|nr:nickel pincer cofactor biosynthesis protein LarC [Terriglobales bacterium]